MVKKKIPAAPSVRRLPSYLHIIKKAYHEDADYISGTVIAEELQLEPIQVRKDLTITGIVGKPKKGYPVKKLIDAIEAFLGWNKEKAAFVGFKENGLNICAAFDTDKSKVGKKIHNIPVFEIGSLKKKAAELKPVIAILTVPTSYAQQAADALVAAGIKAIWNFTNVKISVPDDVRVQKEDLSSGYAMLGVMLNSK